MCTLSGSSKALEDASRKTICMRSNAAHHAERAWNKGQGQKIKVWHAVIVPLYSEALLNDVQPFTVIFNSYYREKKAYCIMKLKVKFVLASI